MAGRASFDAHQDVAVSAGICRYLRTAEVRQLVIAPRQRRHELHIRASPQIRVRLHIWTLSLSVTPISLRYRQCRAASTEAAHARCLILFIDGGCFAGVRIDATPMLSTPLEARLAYEDIDH